jgi:hypothetical protein
MYNRDYIPSYNMYQYPVNYPNNQSSYNNRIYNPFFNYTRVNTDYPYTKYPTYNTQNSYTYPLQSANSNYNNYHSTYRVAPEKKYNNQNNYKSTYQSSYK